MAFTDNCEIYAAFHEDGFNRILRHIQQQRPSLFNYATRAIANEPALLCQVIKPHPVVVLRNNPLITIEDPLPIPGTSYGLNFAVQITNLRIDFHPGDKKWNLPKELDPPLKAQRLAIQLSLCAGIGCPPGEVVEKYIPPPDNPDDKDRENREREPVPVTPLPTRRLHCFCLDVFLVGGVRIRNYYGKPWLEPFADGLEIVDIKPEGLENSLECYAMMMLRLSVLPKMRILLERAPFELMKNVLSVTLKPTPNSPKVPNNPAIEDDQMKAFIEVEV